MPLPLAVMPILSKLWENKKLLLEITGAVIVAVLIWWFVIHNPRKIKDLEQQVSVLKVEVERGQKAIVLLDEIQKNRGRIDAAIQSKISSVRNTAVPANSVVIPGGRVLPAVR